jgi:pimeloyl-ACP methyl ester carboxylesterase
VGIGALQTFTIAIPDDRVQDMRNRIRQTRRAPELDNDDWGFGVSGAYLRDLAGYWADGFDWPAQQRTLNRHPHYRVVIDDVPIHFIHIRGKGPSPTPIMLNHGWPWTFWDFAKVIGPLTDPAAHGGDPADAFDVVIPSLPGFAFSTPLPRTGIGYVETARLWVTLMRDVLGYDRFGSHGGDSGAFVTAQLGHEHAEHMIGVHLSIPVLPGQLPIDIDPDGFSPAERAMWEAQDNSGKHLTHVLVHHHEPQTLAWAMHDSPVGMAAWMLQRRRAWSDCSGDVERRFGRDELLTHFSLYWLTESFASSILYYRASTFQMPPPLAHDRRPAIEAPTALAVFPRELVHVPRSLFAQFANLKRWTVMPAGGHFSAAEEPQLIVDDLRGFFRDLR